MHTPTPILHTLLTASTLTWHLAFTYIHRHALLKELRAAAASSHNDRDKSYDGHVFRLVRGARRTPSQEEYASV